MKVIFIPRDEQFGKYEDRFEYKTIVDCFNDIINKKGMKHLDLYLGINSNEKTNDIFYRVYKDDIDAHYNCKLESIGEIHIQTDSKQIELELEDSDITQLLIDEDEALDELAEKFKCFVKDTLKKCKPVKEFHTYKHYKTDNEYVVTCISESGDKESKTQYVTYISKDEIDIPGAKSYTRTLEDFTKEVKPGVRRFEEVEECN
jgi:hypothetical protein